MTSSKHAVLSILVRRTFRIKVLYVIFFISVSSLYAQEPGYILHYNEPASNDIENAKQHKERSNAGYMQEALPLGNGRLGLMFSGGINKEYLLIN